MKEPEMLKQSINRLIHQNRDGVTIDVIIDYLDYVNKVRYNQAEITPILNGLISENKIKINGGIYQKV
jgi:hypothetical protein